MILDLEQHTGKQLLAPHYASLAAKNQYVTKVAKDMDIFKT